MLQYVSLSCAVLVERVELQVAVHSRSKSTARSRSRGRARQKWNKTTEMVRVLGTRGLCFRHAQRTTQHWHYSSKNRPRRRLRKWLKGHGARNPVDAHQRLQGTWERGRGPPTEIHFASAARTPGFLATCACASVQATVYRGRTAKQGWIACQKSMGRHGNGTHSNEPEGTEAAERAHPSARGSAVQAWCLY